MKEERPLQPILEKILEKKNSDYCKFENDLEFELQQIELRENLESIHQEDREILAALFVCLGEKQLKDQDKNFANSFMTASKLAPNSYVNFLNQGRACFKNRTNLQCLLYAKKAFLRAIELSPDDSEVRFEFGSCLVQHGLHVEEPSLFQEAIDQFLKVESLMVPSKPNSLFYWQFGRTWFYLGKLSGEAMDFKQAIQKYRKALNGEIITPYFWNDYGDAIIELAFLVGNKEYFFEAIDLYQKGIDLDPEYFQGHFNIACAYQCVFEIFLDIEYFDKANEAFEMAAKIERETKSRSAALWLKWGQLLASLGKLKREISYLELSIEKFIQADSIEPNHPGILSRFGEVEMLLGANHEDINLLKQAEHKLILALEIQKDLPEIWYLYGVCLNEMGRYFAEEEYYREAISKFQYGLSVSQSDPLLWYGLAMSHFAIGEMANEREMIEKACKYCSQVLEFGGHGLMQFWNDWAVMLMRLSEMTLDERYLESALEKFEFLLKAHAETNESQLLDFDSLEKQEFDLEWLYNYGSALDMYGDFTDETIHYEQAVQILSNVVKLDPDYGHARYNLALALSHLGESTQDMESLEKATEHFQILVKENPEDETAWNDWGLTLLHQAELVHENLRPDQSKELYREAERKFFNAVSLGSLPSFYNLACLYAMEENFKEAMHYMERAESVNMLPPIEDILHDDWLIDLRTTDAFKLFISQLTNKQERK